jgi:hypothetical protein
MFACHCAANRIRYAQGAEEFDVLTLMASKDVLMLGREMFSRRFRASKCA